MSISAFTTIDAGNYVNSQFIEQIKNLKIHLIAPASSCPDNILSKLANIQSIKIQKKCCIPSSSPMPSVSDNVRFECLQEAINDDSTDIIWAIRGGYGSARLIDQLKFLKKPQKDKIFIGYSDITALHLFFSQKWGWKTIHGAVLREIYEEDKDPSNLTKVVEIISKKHKKIVIDGLLSLNQSGSEQNVIEGEITGGNLKIVETSVGTDWQIISKDKILFLEEIGEAEYQIDRTLIHLKQAGLLDVKAIVFGSFETIAGKSQEISLRKFARENLIPIFKTNKFGHGKFNYPIIYGANAKIIKNNDSYSLQIYNNSKIHSNSSR